VGLRGKARLRGRLETEVEATRDGYSVYDESFVYEFSDDLTGELKSWWLREDEPVESWQKLFELLNE
jgi:hypothetical protein